MTYIPGQPVHFEGVDYIVRTVDEVLVDSEIPGVPRVNTIATLGAVDGSHDITIHVLNSDNVELLEEST